MYSPAIFLFYQMSVFYMCVHVCTCVYMCMCVYLYRCIGVYVYMCMHVLGWEDVKSPHASIWVMSYGSNPAGFWVWFLEGAYSLGQDSKPSRECTDNIICHLPGGRFCSQCVFVFVATRLDPRGSLHLYCILSFGPMTLLAISVLSSGADFYQY